MGMEVVEVNHGAKIKVVGVGGAGGNAINNMIQSGLTGVEFIAANTDLQSLETSQASCRIQLGADHTRGLGAGGDPEVGRRAAEETREAIANVLEGADMVFITCGLGGGTGTGAAPLVAELAKEIDALTVAVVTKPFMFEGRRRLSVAESGMAQLRQCVDTLLTIPNDKLLEIAPKNALALQMFKQADDVLYYGTKGISDLVTVTGYINPDFADLRAIMSERGALALMGTGSAVGENRAVEAASKAISNPLLDDISMSGAKGVLINMTTGPDVMMSELQDAATMIQREADEEGNVIWGWVVDPNAGEEFRVTVIATGIGAVEEASQRDNLEVIGREYITERQVAVGGGGSAPARETMDMPYGLQDDYPSSGDSYQSGGKIDQNDLDIPTFARRAAD